MERPRQVKREPLSVERGFVDSRLGPAQLARAYERLVPIHRRRAASTPFAEATEADLHQRLVSHRPAEGA